MIGAFFRSATAAFALLSALGGCGSHATFEFEGLDIAPAEEELTEFPLGEYKIPIPIADQRAPDQLAHRNRLQLEFELYALVSPAEKSQVVDAWDRHEGKIRDRVIRVCRQASLDELQEPELSSLKARLIDSLAGPMGEKELRQLLITDVVSQEL